MNRSRATFFFRLVLSLAFVVGLAAKVLAHYFILQAPSYTPHILAYFVVTTSVVYFALHKITNQDPTEFVRAFLSSVVLKIILSGVVVAILFKLDPNGANRNVVFYLCCYALFTALEVVVLFRERNGQ